MTGSSPLATRKLKQLIFAGNVLSNQDAIEEDLDKIDEQRPQDGKSWPSAYVTVFEEMVRTVAISEGYLLNDSETTLLDSYRRLSYNHRYCLIRLVLRKADQWHPVSALDKYAREIGNEYLLPTLADLCKPIKELLQEQSVEIEVKTEQDVTPPPMEREIIDLTIDSEDEDVKPNIATLNGGLQEDSSSKPESKEERLRFLLEPPNLETEPDHFCEDESVMTTIEILKKLTIPQLKVLGAQMGCKLKAGMKKPDMISKLLHNAATQTVLGYVAEPVRKGKGKQKSDGLKQTRLPFMSSRRVSLPGTKSTQEEHLKAKALRLLGKCIRVRPEFHQLVRRLHIICFRETEHPTALLLPALLTTFKKREYTHYKPTRSERIWSSRQDLLEYERALELETILDELMEAEEDKPRRKTTKTPSACVNDNFTTPPPTGDLANPLAAPGSISRNRSSRTPGVKREDDRDELELGVGEGDVQITKEAKIKNHLETWIYPEWKRLLAERQSEKERLTSPGLERFESGHVFTRMLQKCTKSLGTLKEYELELSIVNDLLSQPFWRRGKRSVWYERRAVIQGHLTRKAISTEAKRDLQWETLEGIKEALMDEDTSLIHRPELVKRLLALEIKLGVPVGERSRSDGRLQAAPETTLHAVRLPPPHYDSSGKENPKMTLGAYMQLTTKSSSSGNAESSSNKKRLGQKSRWKGKNDQIVNVETRALEHYEEQGYRGFHCETKVLTTIFAILFWDVIFAHVPGAFETLYQVAPLDMFDETFKHARKDLISKRLKEIRSGGWRDIAERHDTAHRAKKTWCIGVSWDLCSKEDLFDILECFGPKSLATICEHFCEDYRGRSSGGPDLFIWKTKDGDKPGVCKFVEVKGPGDRPQANQRVWFDCLHRAQVAVEICWVKDVNQPEKDVASKKRKGKASTASSSRKKKSQDESISEEEDYDRLDPEPEDDPLPDRPLKRQRITTAKLEYDLVSPEGVAASRSGYGTTPSRGPKTVKTETTLQPLHF